MGNYIKYTEGTRVTLAGLVADERMIAEGYFEAEDVTPSYDPSVQTLHYVDGLFQVKEIPKTQAEINKEAHAFLSATDWKVLRHIREKAIGKKTTLSDGEYLALENERDLRASEIKTTKLIEEEVEDELVDIDI